MQNEKWLPRRFPVDNLASKISFPEDFQPLMVAGAVTVTTVFNLVTPSCGLIFLVLLKQAKKCLKGKIKPVIFATLILCLVHKTASNFSLLRFLCSCENSHFLAVGESNKFNISLCVVFLPERETGRVHCSFTLRRCQSKSWFCRGRQYPPTWCATAAKLQPRWAMVN